MSVSVLVADARAAVEELTADEFDRERARGAVVLDVREEAELRTDGRIPGAVHLPRGMLEFCADPSSPYHVRALIPDRRVLLYCANGSRSALAAAALRRIGYTDVAHLAWGFNAWVLECRPVER